MCNTFKIKFAFYKIDLKQVGNQPILFCVASMEDSNCSFSSSLLCLRWEKSGYGAKVQILNKQKGASNCLFLFSLQNKGQH